MVCKMRQLRVELLGTVAATIAQLPHAVLVENVHAHGAQTLTAGVCRRKLFCDLGAFTLTEKVVDGLFIHLGRIAIRTMVAVRLDAAR